MLVLRPPIGAPPITGFGPRSIGIKPASDAVCAPARRGLRPRTLPLDPPPAERKGAGCEPPSSLSEGGGFGWRVLPWLSSQNPAPPRFTASSWRRSPRAGLQPITLPLDPPPATREGVDNLPPPSPREEGWGGGCAYAGAAPPHRRSADHWLRPAVHWNQARIRRRLRPCPTRPSAAHPPP